MRTIRTDLAVEAHEYYVGDGVGTPEGVQVEHENFKDINVTIVKITNHNGEQLLKKKQGTYITIEIDNLMPDYQNKNAEIILSQKLSKLLADNNITEKDSIIVVGLGNHNITPDALGPKTISQLDITRHLFEYLPDVLGSIERAVSAIAPGVLGNTGIETGEIIKAVCEKIKPKAVIAIDALASRSSSRVGTTIQLADTGIHPGSGVGNKRIGINFDTLGIPVIAIGVPTVVDAATIADDAVESTLEGLKNSGYDEFADIVTDLNEDERYRLIRHSMGDMADMMVTPKEIDNIVSGLASLLANGINLSLH